MLIDSSTAAGVCNLCLAISLSEFLSAWPTAGGQYHWVAVISWKKYVPILSWITGWINVSGWIALVASGGLLGSQLIVGIISLTHPNYEPQRWHQFLLYIAYNVIAFIVNAFMTSLLPLITKLAFIWSIIGFVVISITVLATASPEYNDAKFVFTDFINTTGWPDGVAWLLGLLQAGLGLTGFDGVAHMVEELGEPAIQGPKVMIGCVLIGVFTGFIFLMIMLFVAGNANDVIESAAGPLLQIFYHATGNKAGAICLLIFPLVCLLFATISIATTSTRMTYAFARDNGLPFSRVFSRVHPRLALPLNALYLTMACVLLFGLIFLGSNSAFNAIVSASVVALGVSYAMPIAVNCLRGRKCLPETRAFKVSEPVGWMCNLVSFCPVSFSLG